MKIISGKDNPTYKEAKSLLRKKYRDRYGQYLIEGEKVVKEALLAGVVTLVIVRKGKEDGFSFLGDETIIMEGSLMDSLMETETSQDLLAIVAKQEENREKFFKTKGNVMVLDQLQDPGNVGTIIRTAEAAGFAGIVLLKGSADVYSPKVVRATSGALLRMPHIYLDSEEDLILELEKSGKKIVGTCLEEAKVFYEEDFGENCAIIIGNEGRGMSPYLKEHTHLNVMLPMKGEIESLNAAVAAGILMYQSIKKG